MIKTIEQAAGDYVDNMSNNDGFWDAFCEGTDFIQQWYDIKTDLPPHITHETLQTNGNTLYFYENYIVKGYYENVCKREEIITATYMPSSVCWRFAVHKQINTINFIVTHWKPTEYKLK